MLVLLAVDDRKWRIDVGYGLEGILPDAELGDIGRLMVPYLRANDYDDAVLAAVGKIAQVIAFDSKINISDTQAEPPVAPTPPGRVFSTGQIIFIALALLVGIGPIFIRIGYEIGRAIGLWKGPFPWRGYGNAQPSFRGDDASSGSGSGGGGSSDSGSGGDSSPSGGGEFGGGGAGGSW